MMKRALVTGAAGFLGSHLCYRLMREGYEVTGLDNLYTGSLRNLGSLMAGTGFTFIEGDVAEPLKGEFDEIYNLACPASPVHYQSRPVATLKTSVLGMMNVLELASQTGARVLHTSTSEIYGDPLVHPQVESYWGNVNTIGIRSCYDEGKRCAETLAADYRRERGVDVRMVRIFNTYGPNMHPQDGRVVSNFIMQALRGEDLTIFGDGKQTRSFQYCDDLIAAIRLFMMKSREEVDAFFTGRELTISEAEGVRVVCPPVTPVLNTGNPSEFTMLELADEVLRLVNEYREDRGMEPTKSRLTYALLPSDDPKKRKPDIMLAKHFLGWEPRISLTAGLKKTIAYFAELEAKI